MIKQLYLPLAVFSSVVLSTFFVGNASNSLTLAIFGTIVVALNVVVLPLVFQLYVSKPNVDMAYYLLGLIGVILFFEAERFEREISELRQRSFDEAQAVQRIEQRISSSIENIQRQLDAALQRLEALGEASENDSRLFSELKDDQSELALRLSNLTSKNVAARFASTDVGTNTVQQDLLNVDTLSGFVNYHSFGPLQANLVRSEMDPTEAIIPFRVRECLLNETESCEIPEAIYQQDETLVAQLRTNLGQYDNGSLDIHAQLERTELRRQSSEEELKSALGQRDQGSTVSDGIFVYADRFRRSFWPYAIIIAFSLKLASANSARSNEARANTTKALELHSRAALTVKPDSRLGVRAHRKAIRISRRQLRRSETLGEAGEASEIMFKLVVSAEENGQFSLAKQGLIYCIKFAGSFKPYKETSSGLVAKARLLQRSGDLLVLLAEDIQARKCFSSSYDVFLDAQQRSFLDDGVFGLATAIVRMAIVEARLGNDASAKRWLEMLKPLRREMTNESNSEVDNMLVRAKTTLKGLS